jgi:hypothetical protein
MATDYQQDFVNNIEASIKALAVQGKTPPSISAIMEDAGYDAGGLFAIVQRLKEGGEKELLSRLRSAFEYAKKMPISLEDVKPVKIDSRPEVLTSPPGFFLESQMVDSEPLGDSPRPKYKSGKVAAPTAPVYPPTEDEATALAHVLSILRPLKHQGRSRILGASSIFFGVGE